MWRSGTKDAQSTPTSVRMSGAICALLSSPLLLRRASLLSGLISSRHSQESIVYSSITHSSVTCCATNAPPTTTVVRAPRATSSHPWRGGRGRIPQWATSPPYAHTPDTRAHSARSRYCPITISNSHPPTPGRAGGLNPLSSACVQRRCAAAVQPRKRTLQRSKSSVSRCMRPRLSMCGCMCLPLDTAPLTTD